MTSTDGHTGGESFLRGYSGRIFIILTVSMFAISLGKRLLPPLLPVIVDDLVITPLGAGVALTLFQLVRAGIQYPGGLYADLMSRNTVLVLSLILATASFSLLAVTSTYVVLLVGLAAAGAANGLFDPASRAQLSDLFVDHRGAAFGINMSASELTGIAAAGIAIALVGTTSWQTAFLLAVPLFLVLAVVFLVISREPFRIARIRFPVRDTARRLFGQPRIRQVVAAYALRAFANNGLRDFLPLFLIAVKGFSFELASGAYAIPYVIGLVVKPSSGHLSDRTSKPLIGATALIMNVVGLSVLILAPTATVAIAGVVIFAIGEKSFGAPVQAYLMDIFPEESMGGDFGATRTIQMIIGSFGPAFVGTVAGVAWYVEAFSAMIAVLLASMAILVRLELTQ